MAAQDVQILKKAGSIAVRYANGNLSIPGFKLLERCNTTVDMDQDPEVFMMLEPIAVNRYLNKATPNTDSRNSSRRLRFIFKGVIMFFRWRLPSDEKRLRENGLDNLPDEVFEEIKAAFSQTDAHFSRFSAMTIKRCLQLFTANVMDHARTLLPTAKGNTAVRDLAREAWAYVKHFKAMMTQDWATIPEPNDSSTSGPPPSDPPSSGPPPPGPPPPGPHTAGPSGAPSQYPHQPNPSTRVGKPPSSSAAIDAAGQIRQIIPTSAANARGRGRSRGRQRVTRGRGGPTALKPKPRGGRGSGPSRQDNTIPDGPSSRTNTTSSPKTPEKRVTRSAKSSPTSVLGKHPRAEPDLDEAKESRPAVLQKQYDNVFDAARADFEARQAWHEREHEKYIAERNEWYDKAWAVSATHRQLACEVLDLRRRVRTLEKEKKEALSNQRQQLRPGLVTMNMTPRVQQRVKRLFPPTGKGSGASSSKAPWSYHVTWAPWPSTRTPHHVGIETWMDHIENEATPGDDETLPPPWDETPEQRQKESTPVQKQQELKTGPVLPPVGYFRHPKPTESNDRDDESEVPTESSWASTIPA